ncbi:MAG: aminotransferase class I/II-fold pyridoxal phosphate-dependent enzyme, partial [Chitinophagaceae bacterium]|nr:aminotransferase class I/II-fold pyridoxal phosphate-dependent enzyme [Chitinophagaceae bacterium]
MATASDSTAIPGPAADDPWAAPLAADLADLPPQRRRTLRPLEPCGPAGLRPLAGGASASEPLLDLASNDYLGLACHPQLQQAATAAISRDGVGAGASRLVSGSRPVHQQLEQALGAWLGRPRVLLFPSGFQANLAAVQALADRHSLVLADRLIHHSLLVGVKASGAQLQRFAHNDLTALQRRLEEARSTAPQRRLLVLSESLFSMQGTSPDVARLAELCRRHGAALLLDEAHALGVLGPEGRGLGHGL